MNIDPNDKHHSTHRSELSHSEDSSLNTGKDTGMKEGAIKGAYETAMWKMMNTYGKHMDR